ncbi:MAG: hypothetical protein KDH88_04515 [Chromatiales bacterium]|nr:hypothetical protein [Chromatiales bacterium]
MANVAAEHARYHRYTVDDYHRMGEVGILDPQQRMELVEGAIIDMAPIGSHHSGLFDDLDP